MKQEYKKWACGPKFPYCACCTKGTIKDVKTATVRFRRRQDKKAVLAD
jgi:hypothetical protein